MPLANRAPARGQYDRSASREERVSAQHERLLRATAEVVVTGPSSVARVIERAGVGRNTFYEYFDDIAHARAQIREHVTASLQRALQSAPELPQPAEERIERYCRIWMEMVRASPWLWLSALSESSGSLSVPALALREALLLPLREDGNRRKSEPSEEDEVLTFLVAAAAQSAAVEVARAECGLDNRTLRDVASLPGALARFARQALRSVRSLR